MDVVDAVDSVDLGESLLCRVCLASPAVRECEGYPVCEDAGCQEMAYRRAFGCCSTLD